MPVYSSTGLPIRSGYASASHPTTSSNCARGTSLIILGLGAEERKRIAVGQRWEQDLAFHAVMDSMINKPKLGEMKTTSTEKQLSKQSED
jgi:hypothetical protein